MSCVELAWSKRGVIDLNSTGYR